MGFNKNGGFKDEECDTSKIKKNAVFELARVVFTFQLYQKDFS